MQRTLQPEWLDDLAPNEPAARHSRRDLRIINTVMGNPAWFRRTLPQLVRPGDAALEIGAGDGTLRHKLAHLVEHCDGLDLWPQPPGWPALARWHQIDVRSFTGWARYPVVFGNLIFHQFEDHDLARLGQRIRQHARVFVACEPVRDARFVRLFSALCPLIGAHQVTRHDGRTSIAAGFIDDELPRLMGFDNAPWQWQVQRSAFGSYRFFAFRA